MKTYPPFARLVLLACLAAAPASAELAGIDILDQLYHVTGFYEVDDLPGEPPATDSYDSQSSVPAVTESLSYNYQYVSGYSAACQSTAQYLGVTALAGAGPGGIAQALAQAQIIFAPHTPNLTLTVEIHEQLHGVSADHEGEYLTLLDLTAASELLTFHSNPRHSLLDWPATTDTFTWDFTSLDPTHQYQLDIQTIAASYYDESWYSALDVSIAPEPASLFLLTLGICALTRRRGGEKGTF